MRYLQIPLQKQAELLFAQLADVSLSAQPLHLGAQSLQAKSEPADAEAALTCKAESRIKMFVCPFV